MSQEFRYIAGLDLLRFLGALSVVWLHLGSSAVFRDAGLSRFHFMVSGGSGVALFYVISGFLITSLIFQEIRRTGKLDIKRFFLRRSLRIFPLYYFALAVYLACHFIDVQRLSAASFLYAAAYSYNFVPNRLYDAWLGSFWTLAVEEHFYLIYPLIWVLCLRKRWPMWTVLAILMLLTFVTPVLCQPFKEEYKIARWTFNAWGPILIGCLFAQIYAISSKRHQGRQYFLVAFVLLFASQAVSPNGLLLNVSFGFLILHLAYNQEHPLIAALGKPPIRYLGSISYSMYVWQSVILSTGPSRRLVQDPWVAVLAVMVLSAVSWHFIERPLANLRHRVRPSKSVIAADTSS